MDARLSYREAAARGATPVQLVLFLYEQALADMRRALVALQRGNVEARTREINHAIVVIGHLHATLDMDRGGEVAKNLARFYGTLRQGLVDAQCRQSAELLQQQISYLELVREAWLEVQRATALAAQPPAPASPGAPRPSGGWKA